MNISFLYAPRAARLAAFFVLLVLLLPAGFRARAQGAGPAFDRAATCGQPTTGSFYVPVRLAVDAAGNAYVAGYFAGTVVFGNTFLTTGPPPSGGGRDYDWFVAKLDPLGAVLWAVRAGGLGAPDVCRDLCLDGQGHVYVAGTAQGQAAFGTLNLNNNPGGGPRIVVARLDAATGTWQWLAQGGANRNQAYGVAADAAGHVFVAGTVGDRANWANFGSLTISTISGNEDAFVARLDAATGAWQWVSLGGAPFANVTPRAITLDGTGGAYVCGNYGSSAPVQFQPVGPAGAVALPVGQATFVAKLNAATGAWAWANSGGNFGPSGTDLLGSLAVDAAGNVVASGDFRSAAPVFGTTTLTNLSGNDQYGFQRGDGLLVGLDGSTGAWRWAVPISGPGSENCAGVALDANGEAYAVGGFVGPTTFGTRTLTAANGSEAFVARLSAATGAWRWVAIAGGRGAKGATSPVIAGNQLHVLGAYTGAVADIGPVVLAGSPTDQFGFVGRLANATGPLAGRAAAAAGAGLAVWPSPAGAGAWVSGPPPGTPVLVLDALGRGVGMGRMPATGPLALPLPTGRPAGLYLVRAGGRTARLLAE